MVHLQVVFDNEKMNAKMESHLEKNGEVVYSLGMPFFYCLFREDFKYYFADFVRKGDTTPPPLRTKFSKKGSYGFGGYPLC